MPEAFSKNTSSYPVSVVIPTLGGESLRGTIEQINRGTLVPSEILVCIPKEDAFRVEKLLFPNVRVIKTSFRGQVAQRAKGFQLTSNPFVLQLDDDILVRETCLEHLVELIVLDDQLSVGPKFIDSATGKYRSFLVPANTKQTFFEKILYFVINGSEGYQSGQIGESGINMGVPENSDNCGNLGWLPGGCVLHRKQNLILYNYYPYNGKAYAEDLFHSKLLTENGVRMMRCGSALCDVDFSSSSYKGSKMFFREYLAYTRAMTKFVKDHGFNLSRLYIYLLLNLFRLSTRRHRKIVKAY